MLYFINRPLILEQEILNAFKQYFDNLQLQSFYKNWSVNVYNEHPFALMLNDGAYNSSLFPAIVVSTDSDNKPTELNGLLTEIQGVALNKSDLDSLKDTGYMVCDEVIEELKKVFDVKDTIYGVTHFIRRSEKISVEIWSENIQLKNELYEMCRLFIAGGMNVALEHFRETNNLAIFDHSLTGDRSGNYNYDFGTLLSGARLTFDADYFINQIIIDTEINNKNKKIVWEVKNDVKRQRNQY